MVENTERFLSSLEPGAKQWQYKSQSCMAPCGNAVENRL